MDNQTQLPVREQNRPTPAINEFDVSKWDPPTLAKSGFDLSKWGLDPTKYSQLTEYDLPQRMVVPLLLSFRHINTIAGALFYDVSLLWLRLYTRGIMLSTTNIATPATAQDSLAALQAATRLNLSALVNPEGAILVVDAHHAPFVHKYEDVQAFFSDRATFPVSGDGDEAGQAPEAITIVTVTGVGSSALGSVAFAWNVSETLHKPVTAIVPGYGLADLIPQALGGWFGFGVHDFMRRVSQQHRLLGYL